MNFWLALLVLGVSSFFQNMAFTWTSRSRNSGDVSYHRKASWASNGIWFLTQIFLLSAIWPTITNPTAMGFLRMSLVVFVYVIATTEGSVLMMRYLLKHEKGKRRVGAK